MKRTLFIAICIVALTLVSCGNGKPDKVNGNETTVDVSSNVESFDVESSTESGNDVSEDVSKEEYVIGSDVLIPNDINTEDYVYDTENLKYIKGVWVEITGYKGDAKKLIIPAEIDGKPVKRIFNKSFYGNTSVEGIYLEDGIEVVCLSAFEKCIKLREVRLSNTLWSIDSGAFKECINLKEIYIPDSVTHIAHYAFNDCKSLRSVRLPADIKNIFTCFDNCSSLKGTAIMPASQGEVYPIYPNCVGIKTLIIKGGTKISKNAFRGMTGLEEIHIPESVVDFEDIDGLFTDQKNLKKIYVVDGSYAAYALADSVWGVYLCSEVEYE